MKWPKEKYVRWIGILVVGYIMTFIVKDEECLAMGFLVHLLVTILFTAVLWNGAFLIIMHYRRAIPEIEYTTKRLLISSVLTVLFLIIGANVIRLVLGISNFDQLSDYDEILAYAHINILTGLIVTSIYEGNYFFGKWKESVILNEELKNQQIRTQFEVLQNQMSPHFLFNSLNTLTTLISENPKIATDFTLKLSEVYRYILQNKDQQLTTLEDELSFCEDYVYLQKMRYPNNLKVDCSIDPAAKSRYIAPLTIQMLIENGIKHNMVSKQSPLKIDVFIEGDYIVVRNNYQPKTTLEKSTKTGLANIKKRYALFSDNEVIIDQSDEYFSVKVPLVDLINGGR